MWEEISHELYIEGIRPVTPDMDCINTAKEVIVDKARTVQTKQNEFLRKKYEIENERENYYYQNSIIKKT